MGEASRRLAAATIEVEELKEALLQIHQALHKDDVDGAHDLLHQALGSGRVDVAPSEQLNIRAMSEFDKQFRQLEAVRGLTASYVVMIPAPAGGFRVLTGGNAYVDAAVSKALSVELERQQRELANPEGAAVAARYDEARAGLSHMDELNEEERHAKAEKVGVILPRSLR